MPKMVLVLIVGAAWVVGTAFGIMISQPKCEGTAWWNPLAAFRLLTNAQQNPLILLASPEAAEHLKVATGALLSTAVGAVGLAKTRGNRAIKGDDTQEETDGEDEGEEERKTRDAKRKRLKDVVRDLEQQGVYEGYDGWMEEPRTRRARQEPRVIEIVRTVGRSRSHTRAAFQNSCPVMVTNDLGTPVRRRSGHGSAMEYRDEMCTQTPVKISYRGGRLGGYSPGKYSPSLSLFPRGGGAVDHLNGNGEFVHWEPRGASINRALVF